MVRGMQLCNEIMSILLISPVYYCSCAETFKEKILNNKYLRNVTNTIYMKISHLKYFSTILYFTKPCIYNERLSMSTIKLLIEVIIV